MENESLARERIIFAAFLCDLRKGTGISRTQLAEKLQVSEQVVEEWECGNRPIDIAELRTYCRAIGLPLTDCIAFLEKILEKLPDELG